MVDNLLLYKIKDALSFHEISMIIRDSLNDSSLRALFKSIMDADEETAEQLSSEELINELASEIASGSDKALFILSELEKHNLDAMQEVQKMENHQVRDHIGQIMSSTRDEIDGSFLWAILTDTRKETFMLHRQLVNYFRNKNSGRNMQGNYKPDQQKHRDSSFNRDRDTNFSGGNNHGKYESHWSSQAYYQKAAATKGTPGRDNKTQSKGRYQDDSPANRESQQRKRDFNRIYMEAESQKAERERPARTNARPSGPSPYVESLAQQILVLQDRMNSLEQKMADQEQNLMGKLDSVIEELRLNRTEYQESSSNRPRTIRGSESRVGVFVDAQNMFYAAKNQYNARLDYAKLLEGAVDSRRLIKAIVYLVQTPEVDQSAFVAMLQHKNYEVKTKDLRLRVDGSAKGDWDMGMAIDMISMCEKLDVVVLVSGDGDFVSLVNLIKSKGPRVEVYGFPYNTSVDLKEAADEFFPIREEMLLDYSSTSNNYNDSSRYQSRTSYHTPRTYEPSELDFSDDDEEEDEERHIDFSMFDQEDNE